MNRISVNGMSPQLGEDCFVAMNASLIGDVRAGDRCSFWFQSVLRADVFPIRLGHEVNIQDACVLHGTHKKCGVVLADRVSVGHSVVLHGCEVGEGTLIGMGSLIMDGARVQEQSIVAAGSLISPGKSFPPRVLIQGRPARVVRELTPEECRLGTEISQKYLIYKNWYRT